MGMSNNISLRFLENKDAPFMLEWMKDAEVHSQFRFDSTEITMDSVNEFINKSRDTRENAHFAIANNDDEYLGTVSLKNIDYSAKNAEYAIAIRRLAQGKGIGYFATEQILEYAFCTLKLERVYLNVFSDNKKAINLYKKIGFVYEGESKNHICSHGRLHSLVWFRMMREEYESRKKRNTIGDVVMCEFPELGDERGHLVVIEGSKNIPFEIKRIFYIYGTEENVVRGQHANERSSFCLINLSGKSKVRVADTIGNEKIISINKPHMGVYIPKMIWKDMYDFSSDSVLLVLSDEYYDSSEYIRDWQSYISKEQK